MTSRIPVSSFSGALPLSHISSGTADSTCFISPDSFVEATWLSCWDTPRWWSFLSDSIWLGWDSVNNREVCGDGFHGLFSWGRYFRWLRWRIDIRDCRVLIISRREHHWTGTLVLTLRGLLECRLVMLLDQLLLDEVLFLLRRYYLKILRREGR